MVDGQSGLSIVLGILFEHPRGTINAALVFELRQWDMLVTQLPLLKTAIITLFNSPPAFISHFSTAVNEFFHYLSSTEQPQ